MPNEYDHITAFHYSAFRPALHKQILKECLKENDNYSLGLDVGCGTGQSSIALTKYCKKVIGIEPSKEMLKKSIQHSKIEYSYFNYPHIDFPNNSFDLITFAGSLFYAKSQTLLDEVVRVSKDSSRIIIYDFDLSLIFLIEKIGLAHKFQQLSNYDHGVNFDTLDQTSIKVEKEFKRSLSLEISVANISHLLLSSKENYSSLLEAFGKDNLYNKVLQKLLLILTSEKTLVEADTYSTVYRIVK